MNPNPYAPPSSDADFRRTRALPPSRVYGACGLVLAALVLGVIALLPGISAPPPDGQPVPAWFTVAVVVVFGGITVWLAIEVLRGRNWARWSLFIYLLAGWLLGGAQITDDFAQSPLAAAIEALSMAMEVCASWLLFSGSAARWFRERASHEARRP